MADRIKLVPPRSSSIGGPLLLVAGLAFLSAGLFGDFRNPSLNSDILMSLGILAAGLGATIVVYMRRVGLRVLCERVEEGKNHRFRIQVSEPGGRVTLPSGLISTREIRISPRTGPVLFVGLPDNIHLELHRFGSRRKATRQFLKIDRMQHGALHPSRTPALQPEVGRGLAGAVRLVPEKNLALWRDTVSLETALPLAAFLSGMIYMMLHGFKLTVDWEHRAAIFAVASLLSFFGGMVSSSVRYVYRSASGLSTGRFLFRYLLSGKNSLDDFSSLLHRQKTYTEPGIWELRREDALPTAELRLQGNSGRAAAGRAKIRIRLHSSLTASLAIYKSVMGTSS